MVVVLLVGGYADAEDLLKDGGFEDVAAKPDGYGNPFTQWGGWKWEGDCQRVGDTDIRHTGRSSCLMMSHGACKIAVSQKFDTQPGFYKLSGYVRTVNLKPGTYDRGAVLSFEPKGTEIMDGLPKGTYGWRKFERIYHFPEAVEGNLFYIYLFGSGKMWLDDLSIEKVEGEGLKEGLLMGDPEEKFVEYKGADGMKCPSCGMMLDPKAPKCGICGESTAGLKEYDQAVKLYEEMAKKIEEAKAKGIDVLYWQAAAIPMRVGLNERWNNFPGERPETLAYAKRRAPEVIAEIDDVLAGKREARKVPPMPDLTRTKLVRCGSSSACTAVRRRRRRISSRSIAGGSPRAWRLGPTASTTRTSPSGKRSTSFATRTASTTAAGVVTSSPTSGREASPARTSSSAWKARTPVKRA
jgi:hypothetical protein